MSKNLYQAALHQIKGKALESLAVIEVLLNNPAAVSDHTDYVGEIIKHAELLAQYEGAMVTLNQYFGPPPAAPAQPPPQPLPPPVPPREPPPESSESLTITEERSPTMRRAAKKRKMMEGSAKRTRARKKNEEE